MELLALGIFSVVLVWLGWLFGDVTTSDAYSTANRASKTIFVAFGAFTIVGASTFIGVTQFTYIVGFYAIALGVGATVGAIALALNSRSAYEVSRSKNLDTLPDSVAAYYGIVPGSIVTIFSVIGLFALLTIQISAGGIMISAISELTIEMSIFLMGMVVALYVYLGGLKAIFITDLVQGVAMFVLIGGALVVMYATGFQKPTLDVAFPAIFEPNSWGVQGFIAVLFVVGFLSISGGADVWLRLFSAESPRSARNGLLVSSVMFFLFLFILTLFGLGVVVALPEAAPGSAFLQFVQTELPDWIMPVIVVGIFAGAISTADAETHVISTMITSEVERWRGKDNVSDGQSLMIARGIAVFALVASAFFAYDAGESLGSLYNAFLNILMITGVAAWAVLLKRGRPATMTIGLLASMGVFVYLLVADRMFVGAWSLLVPAPLAAVIFWEPLKVKSGQ